MLELSPLVSAEEADPLRATAVAITRALDDRCEARAQDDDGLLRSGTGNRPAGINVQVSLIYGDCFFLETLANLRGRRETIW